jgi:hypothetical protein
MKSDHQTICLAACFLIAGAGGYCLQALYDRPVSALTASESAGLDCFLTVRSFSEVENARALMEALATRSLQDLRIRRMTTQRAPSDAATSHSNREAQLTEIIGEFRAAIREFGGTGQEMWFVQDLLAIFRREGRHDEWVSLYLQHLYRDPTHEFFGRTAREALVIGKDARREPEVFEALNHLRCIPLEFEAKSAIESVLASSGESLYLARSEAAAARVGPER